MTVQIIFFLALAAFIILFAHRYSLKSESFRKVLVGAASVVSGLGRWLAGMFGRVRLSRPRRQHTVPQSSFSEATASGEQGFWATDEPADKPEIASHFEEGDQLFRRGKHKEAEQFFLKAAANNPGDAKVYARLGLLYLEQKNYSDAIEALKVAVKLEKYNPSRHYNLALAYWGNKDTRRAIASVREAIGLDPVTEKYRKLLEQLLNG